MRNLKLIREYRTLIATIVIAGLLILNRTDLFYEEEAVAKSRKNDSDCELSDTVNITEGETMTELVQVESGLSVNSIVSEEETELLEVTNDNGVVDDNTAVNECPAETDTQIIDLGYIETAEDNNESVVEENLLSSEPESSDMTVSENSEICEEETVTAENNDNHAVETENPVTTEVEGKDALLLLNDSVANDSGTYTIHTDQDIITVFAENVANSFSINTAVSYNIWGGCRQSVVYNASKLRQNGDILSMLVGIEKGGDGVAVVEIFGSDNENPLYEITVDASKPPVALNIDLTEVGSTMEIRVTNQASTKNRLIFFELRLYTE